MKKIIVLVLIVFCVGVFVYGDAQKKTKDDTGGIVSKDPVTKSYILKHVSPGRVHEALRQYYFNSSYDAGSNIITVRIPPRNIADFERMLKLMDVEKQKALLRIFTVIASKEGKPSAIDNKDLKKVLTELKKVLSFNTFRVDGVSALTITDGQRNSLLKLTSIHHLNFQLEDIHIRKGDNGRSVSFSFSLKQKIGTDTKDKPLYDNLIYSTTSVKENGYLVAGVSKIGHNGASLVLVINAQIL
jgi:hypothetical protein